MTFTNTSMAEIASKQAFGDEMYAILIWSILQT